MKKIVLSILAFGLLNSNLFAKSSFDGNFYIGGSISKSTISTQYKESDKMISSKSDNTYPMGIYAGYRFYLFDGYDLALNSKVYYNYSSSTSEIKYLDIKNSAPTKEHDVGANLTLEYDLFKVGEKFVYGIGLGLGYEYSMINTNFSDMDTVFKNNKSTFTTSYGIYLNYDNTHRLNLGMMNRSYNKNGDKRYYQSGESYEFINTPSDLITTISYTYTF